MHNAAVPSDIRNTMPQHPDDYAVFTPVSGATYSSSSGAVTVTAAVPLLLVSTVDVAVTVKLVAVSCDDTVSVPSVEMEVPSTCSPSMPQVTSCDGLLSPFTVATNFFVPPFYTDAVTGSTVTEVTPAALTTVGIRKSSMAMMVNIRMHDLIALLFIMTAPFSRARSHLPKY